MQQKAEDPISPFQKATIVISLIYEEFNEMMSSYGAYMNFNKLMQLDNSCFYDADHLSQKGVELFNHRLIQMMDFLQWRKGL